MSLTGDLGSTASTASLQTTTPAVINAQTDNSKAKSKQVKRSRHCSLGVSYHTDDDEFALEDTGKDTDKDTVKQKKTTRARKKAKDTSCDRDGNKSSGVNGASCERVRFPCTN